MSIDAKELERLKAKLGAMGSDQSLDVAIVQTVANRVLAKTKKGTPTKTGELRRNWKIKPITYTSQGTYTYVFNPLEYAIYVEYGHRTRKNKDGSRGWVEGNFMLTNAVNAVNRDMDKICKKAINDYVKKYSE